MRKVDLFFYENLWQVYYRLPFRLVKTLVADVSMSGRDKGQLSIVQYQITVTRDRALISVCIHISAYIITII